MHTHTHTQPDIPTDIWHHVAQFIGKEELKSLISLNRVFFELGMNEKYREVELFRFDEYTLLLLKHLRRKPIASRIRTLRVRPHMFHDTPLNENPRNQSPPSPLYVIYLIQELVPRLTNLEEYHISWFGPRPAYVLSCPLVIGPIKVARGLRKLVLESSLERMGSVLIGGGVGLGTLREVVLDVRDKPVSNPNGNALHTSQLRRADRERERIMQTCLVPCLNTATNLRSLTFHSIGAFDYSTLFYGIRLPSLESLTLSIPLTHPHLGAPAAIHTFLRNHARTLVSLELDTHLLTAVDVHASSQSAHEDSIVQWFSEALQPASSSSSSSAPLQRGPVAPIENLTIPTSSYPFGVTTLLLSHFSSTLTSVNLARKGSMLSFAQVSSVLDVLGANSPNTYSTSSSSYSDSPNPLRDLSLGISALSPELLDLCATKVPSLKRLMLVVGHIVPHKDEKPVYVSVSVDMASLVGTGAGAGRRIGGGAGAGAGAGRPRRWRRQDPVQESNFFTQMSQRMYEQWSLRELEVWKCASMMQYQSRCVEFLKGCLPRACESCA